MCVDFPVRVRARRCKITASGLAVFSAFPSRQVPERFFSLLLSRDPPPNSLCLSSLNSLDSRFPILYPSFSLKPDSSNDFLTHRSDPPSFFAERSSSTFSLLRRLSASVREDCPSTRTVYSGRLLSLVPLFSESKLFTFSFLRGGEMIWQL